VKHPRPVLAGKDIDENDPDGYSHPLGEGAPAGLHDAEDKEATEDGLRDGHRVESHETGIEQFRIEDRVSTGHDSDSG